MRPSSGVCRCLSVARWSPRIARKTRFSGVYTVVFIELRISEIGNWTELAHFQQVVRAFNNYSLWQKAKGWNVGFGNSTLANLHYHFNW